MGANYHGAGVDSGVGEGSVLIASLQEERINVALGEEFEVLFPDQQPIVHQGEDAFFESSQVFDGDAGGEGVGFELGFLFLVALLSEDDAYNYQSE